MYCCCPIRSGAQCCKCFRWSGGSRVLAEGLLPPRAGLWAALACGGVALAAIGAVWVVRLSAAAVALLLLATALAMTRPQRGVIAIVGLGLAGVVSNLLAHLVVGGFAAGVWFLLWIVILPFSVYLSGARRQGVVVLGAALLAIAVALAADLRLAVPTPLPDWLKLGYNGFVLTASVVIVFLWGVYVFQQLDLARRRADVLLLSILPAPIADRLKRGPATIANGYDEVTVLFADIVNFTGLSADADPVDVVSFLNWLFSQFDDLAARHGLEKIKTIGDAYLAVCGLPLDDENHAENVVHAALEIREFMKQRRENLGAKTFEIRIGINSGSVVAGIVGVKKFQYDIWGDTVNTANRMETLGEVGEVNISEATYQLIKSSSDLRFSPRGKVPVKGKGEMEMFFVDRSSTE